MPSGLGLCAASEETSTVQVDIPTGDGEDRVSTEEDLNISGVRSLTQVLERTPNGNDMVVLATKLGIWTAAAHNTVTERRPFPKNLSDMGPNELTNLLAEWTSEFGRITELVGLLNGQKEQLKIRGKSLRAAARSRLRRDHPKDEKPLASTALNDAAEEDTGVLENDERIALVELLLASATATKEATQQYIGSISREIAYRDAQMKARMY